MNWIKNRWGFTGMNAVILSLAFFSFNHHSKNNIVLESNGFKYEISSSGKNLSFIDKTSGIDYLNADTVSYCAYVKKSGKEYYVTSVSVQGGKLIYGFGDAGVTAEINLVKENDRLVFEVLSVTGDAESLTFVNVPLKLEAMPWEPFAACVLSMNLFTHVRQLPALQDHLWAACYKRFGMEGAEAAMLGVPMEEILPSVRGVIRNAEDIPFSDKGGAWAQLEKEGYGSYLMDFGSLTEKTVDETIKQCRELGFNQVIIHGGGEFYKHGEFELNRAKWPDGWQSFKRINDKLHEAGISSILLTYTFFIDKSSKYVTPVPSEDLGYFSSFTLAEPLGPDDDEIVVKESTSDVSPVTGYFVRNSRTLRVGNELIEFNEVTPTYPYKFKGLTRGVSGTQVTTHPVNEKAYHLREMFGLFVPGPETPLFRSIAKRTAEITDECGFDGLYFDAIDGNDLLAGKENAWYYGTKFIFEVARNLKKPVGMEMCDMPHHYWHYSSRWQAWDRPTRGYKRFIDIHLAAIKSDDPRHGEWMGHTPVINKLAPAENGRLLLPLHLGWWRNYTWDPPQTEPTFPDDIEYLCCKMIGNNAGLSMLGGVDDKTLKEYPLFGRLTPIIKQYEELRHKNYFNDSIRSLLRQPGEEFTLFREEGGGWNFKPVTYQKHKIEGANPQSAKWEVCNKFESQPVKLRIELLMSVKAFDDDDNILLAEFSSPKEFNQKGNAKGVTGRIEESAEKNAGHVGPVGLFNATSKGESPQEGSWLKMEKKFDPWLNLENNQALGVWVKGDGKGELLNLRIESPQYISMGARGDHFIKIDFTGWRYFELVETESSRFNDYIWPDEYFNVYNSYFYKVDFGRVDKLQLWYNNLPKDKEVSCRIGAIKALPMIPNTVKNPTVIIGEEKIVFPVEMESGMYIEMLSQGDCKLYGAKGELIQEIRLKGEIPEFQKGNNDISFTYENVNGIHSRFQVTIIGEGEPLLKNEKN
ncbi:hypothetical protein [Mariniphaga sediminis]|uniref:hypothetical protein n=1 Tax=Mariniphaga sediminis TaxID=1628158 RepID=UPI00356967E9